MENSERKLKDQLMKKQGKDRTQFLCPKRYAEKNM